MNAQQLSLFPQGEDTPLFSGTPMRARIEPFQPREVEKPTRLTSCVCATCQDTGTIKRRGKNKSTTYCMCMTGQATKSRATLEALPESERTKKLRELYAEPTDDADHVLREALVIESPAVRMANLGSQALTLIELLSFVLGTPNDPLTASYLLMELKTLVKIKAHTALELAKLGHGMTLGRAERLLAALELGTRLREPREIPPIIKSPADAADLLRDMALLEQEQMRVILLDTKNHVIQISTVYTGSVNTTVIRVAELMRAAVRANATAMLIAHNHPSHSEPVPSPEDIAVTSEIVKAAKLLDIDCVDHLVIGSSGKFVSLKERGLGFS